MNITPSCNANCVPTNLEIHLHINYNTLAARALHNNHIGTYAKPAHERISHHMLYIESKSKDPYFNLALEDHVFYHLDKRHEYFILWQNSNTIVVGKYQNTAEEINREFVEEKGIRVARRLTGGGAVYHDEGNLNFTYIVDCKDGNILDFKHFATPVINALHKLGTDAEFSGRNDLLIDGKKISGSSQFIAKGRVLNHGCIMLDSNLSNVIGALKPKDAKFDSKSTKSVRSRVTTINENLPNPISMAEFKQAILNEIQTDEKMQEYLLTDEDYEQIEALKKEKYSTWEWNYGITKEYGYSIDRKFDFGLVSIKANVERGIIKEIRIFGDFFGDGDIEQLESALAGERLDSGLGKRIEEKLDIREYIRGMTTGQLRDMLP